MKRALLFLLCILACFVFVSCTEEPEEPKELTANDFFTILEGTRDFEKNCDSDNRVKEEYEFPSGAKEVTVYDGDGKTESTTYTMASGQSSAVKYKGGTYKIDNVTADETAFDNWFANFQTENPDRYKAIKINASTFNVVIGGTTSTYVLSYENKILEDGTKELTTKGIKDNNVIYTIVIRTKTEGHKEVYTYLSVNGYELSPSIASILYAD